MASPAHVANIGARGATRRARNGYVWLVGAIVAALILIATGAPRALRLALLVPFGAAAIGLLQAREKT
jgi:hypothetical protein